MLRNQKFCFLCTQIERDQIASLARHLQRSQSDAIRFVISEVIKELGINANHIQTISDKENKK